MFKYHFLEFLFGVVGFVPEPVLYVSLALAIFNGDASAYSKLSSSFTGKSSDLSKSVSAPPV